MKKGVIIFPHQLFEEHPALKSNGEIYLIEELLFFRQYNFHKQKILFHRASLKFYESYLKSQGKIVHYIESHNPLSDIRKLITYLKTKGVNEIHLAEPADDLLMKRLRKKSSEENIEVSLYPSPAFLNTEEELKKYFEGKKRFLHNDFYITQRKKFNILICENGKPEGGKWSYDSENRLKYPAKKNPPSIKFPSLNKFTSEAVFYVEKNFTENYGLINKNLIYPVTFDEAKEWLNQFLNKRFNDFGNYEDAIVARENILHHSLLSPLLNTGLLIPDFVIEKTLQFAEEYSVSLNSLEGFIRQIMGWREFIRGVYLVKGVEQRNKNFWGFERKIPKTFWTGETGIEPLDITIKKVLDTGYCHHIERLMVIGNFMLLCEFDPDEVYRWFMELFIDAYDWVMVPNVYGMSQFADGGLMATKPYISGSNYLMKMSDYKKGEWQNIWDGLFWRFIDKHRNYFSSNPRLSMMVRSFDKMNREKKENLLITADSFLKSLDN